MRWVSGLVLFAGMAWGCSCLPQRPVCEMYAGVPAVFRGTVLRYRDGVYLVRVQERFKGVGAGDGEVIVDPGVMGPCKTTHSVGGEYLFLAFPVEKTMYPLQWRGRMPVLATGMCSGTLAVRDAGSDLAWLRGEKKTRVYGQVVQTDPVWRGRAEVVALPGARVTLRDGATERVVNSGVDGAFSFEGIRPGEYTLTALRYGWRPVVEEGVGVVAGGCAKRMLFAGAGGRMEGVVLRHDGVPARGVTVELVRVGAATYSLWVRTDEAGRFALEDVPAGEFYVGVNLRSPTTAEAPWPARYFPGTDSESGARVFRTRPNESIRGMRLILPPPQPVRSVRVRAVWADGTAADGVGISAEPLGVATAYDVGSWVERGSTLTLQLMQGYAYRLRASTAEPLSVESDAVVLGAGMADAVVTLRLNRRQ